MDQQLPCFLVLPVFWHFYHKMANKLNFAPDDSIIKVSKFHPCPSPTFWDIKQSRRRRRADHDTWKINETNLTSKIIGGWIEWPNMQLLFKFQVNRMKTDNFTNSAYVVLLAYFDLENNWCLNSVTWYANPLQISSQGDENWGF